VPPGTKQSGLVNTILELGDVPAEDALGLVELACVAQRDACHTVDHAPFIKSQLASRSCF